MTSLQQSLHPIFATKLLPAHRAWATASLESALQTSLQDARVDPEDKADYAYALAAHSIPSYGKVDPRAVVDAMRRHLAAQPNVPEPAPAPSPTPELPRVEPTPTEEEEPVLDGRAQRTLALLREHFPEWVGPNELRMVGGSKYQSRIGELREAGYQVETSATAEGERASYRLVSETRLRPDTVRWGVHVRIGSSTGIRVLPYETAALSLDHDTLARIVSRITAVLDEELPPGTLRRVNAAHIPQ